MQYREHPGRREPVKGTAPSDEALTARRQVAATVGTAVEVPVAGLDDAGGEIAAIAWHKRVKRRVSPGRRHLEDRTRMGRVALLDRTVEVTVGATDDSARDDADARVAGCERLDRREYAGGELEYRAIFRAEVRGLRDAVEVAGSCGH